MPLHQNHPLFGRSIFSMLFLATINAGIVQAQITLDGTLPTRIQQLENMRKITGGERVGDNLFHSFEKFSIPEGIEAIFENAPDIQNIFTRVTGNEPSFVNGLLQTAGGANFFLINPNGIVFGENARLDVGGSFIATTANSVEFADGSSFDARSNNQNVTLTWNAPIGLGLDGNNGSITVNGSGYKLTRDSLFSPLAKNSNLDGLQVQSGKTLALVGGDVTIKGGTVVAESGQVELASVDSGTVDLDISQDRLSFDYKEVSSFKDIQLSEQALVDASGMKNSLIQVTGANVELREGSVLLMQNAATSTPGTIKVDASDSIIVQGESLRRIPSSITTEALGSGDAADIQVSAHNLVVRDGGAIATGTFDTGKTGNIDINIAQTLQLDRTSEGISNGNFRSFIAAFTVADGNVGTISIAAQKLFAERGASIQSATYGKGNAGDVNMNTRFVELNGATEQDALFTFINSGAFSTGNAGNVNINTESLRLINGGAVSSDSIANGNTGNVVVNASDFIEVNGLDSNTRTPSTLTSSVTVEENEDLSLTSPELPPIPSGNAGSVTLKTPTLNISQGGTVRVINQGSGNAGTLNITADNLNLDRSGRITAAASSGLGGNIELNTQNLNITNDSQITASAGGNENGGNISINTTNLTAKKNNQITASAFEGDGGNVDINAANSVSLNERDSITAISETGEGGNITLNTDQLQLQNNSLISTSAGGLGNGGNIEITAGTILAINDSDITATAVRGNGGNITITADGILGIEERKATPGNGTSDIDASSEFGEDGTVKISDPQVLIQDPVIALREIPISDTTKELIEDICAEGKAIIKDSRHPDFPEMPDDLPDQPSSTTSEDFTPPSQKAPKPTSVESLVESLAWKPGDPLLPANHVVTLDNGRQFLVPKAQWEYIQLKCKAVFPKTEEEAKNLQSD